MCFKLEVRVIACGVKVEVGSEGNKRQLRAAGLLIDQMKAASSADHLVWIRAMV